MCWEIVLPSRAFKATVIGDILVLHFICFSGVRLTDWNFQPIDRGCAFTRLMKFGQRQANEGFCRTLANSAWVLATRRLRHTPLAYGNYYRKKYSSQ